MASRFVYSTLNGMFVAQLAAWMVTPIESAAMASKHPAHPSTTLNSRANDDPATSLDEEWSVSIPRKPQRGPSGLEPIDAQISTRDIARS